MKKTYKIEVDCAACADKMEQAARKTQGVAAADAVMQQVLKNCKRVEDDCEIFL